MKVVITGATGLIGSRLVGSLTQRGDEVVVLSRDAARTSERLGVPAAGWDPTAEPAPVSALQGTDAVVHLAGEPVAQRWSDAAKERIRSSRLQGTANLVAGLRAAGDARPGALLSSSAAGYYGNRGDAPLDEAAAPGEDFLAAVCVGWEQAADEALSFGVRVAKLRTGVVLDRDGGALAKMLPPFRAGIGGPVAGGRQYVPWIALDDVVGLYLAALDGGAQWSGAFNACAPEPVTNAELSRALGRALHRPAVMPVPAIALRLLYGEMARVVTGGARMLPTHALTLGYEFHYPGLDQALQVSLGT